MILTAKMLQELVEPLLRTEMRNDGIMWIQTDNETASQLVGAAARYKWKRLHRRRRVNKRLGLDKPKTL